MTVNFGDVVNILPPSMTTNQPLLISTRTHV